MKYFKYIYNKIRYKYYPTNHQIQKKKFLADGGVNLLYADYNLNENSVVLDIGGYKGQWSSDLYSIYRCKIYIFEPVKNFYEQISIRYQSNPDIQVNNYGLGSNTRNEIIGVCNDGSSIYRQSKNTEYIKIVDINEWLVENKIYNVDLMKLNIEGGEYELLNRLIEINFIKRIDNIQIQFHDLFSESETKMKAIQNKLEITHYSQFLYKFIWENWKRR